MPPRSGKNRVIDWIDVLIGYGLLAAALIVTATFGWSLDSRIAKGLMATLLIAGYIARRVVLGPPAEVAVSGPSALGVVGLSCLLAGLIFATFTGTLLYDDYTKPLPAPTKIDHDAMDRHLALPGVGRTCTIEGRPARGRACMTAEDRAKEVAEDAALAAEELRGYEHAHAELTARHWRLFGIASLFVIVGIALDVWRVRRTRGSPA